MTARLYELPCGHCHVKTCVEFLVDVSELAPLCKPVCEECEHELVADMHDDPTCDCASCERMRAKADRARRQAEAATCGGLSAEGLRLLGFPEDA